MSHWPSEPDPNFGFKSSNLRDLSSCLPGATFAEWSDSDANNGDEDPGDVPGSNVFLFSLAVLLGFGVGCSASLSSGALGALSPL